MCIAPRPAEPSAKIRPAMAMRPFFGIQPALMDDKVKFASLSRTKLYSELVDKIKYTDYQNSRFFIVVVSFTTKTCFYVNLHRLLY